MLFCAGLGVETGCWLQSNHVLCRNCLHYSCQYHGNQKCLSPQCKVITLALKLPRTTSLSGTGVVQIVESKREKVVGCSDGDESQESTLIEWDPEGHQISADGNDDEAVLLRKLWSL